MEEQAKKSLRLERARWRSRRGLLELELLLEPFVNGRLPALPPASLEDYERLLEHDDVDIHEWILARSQAPDAVAPMVAEIRSFLSLG